MEICREAGVSNTGVKPVSRETDLTDNRSLLWIHSIQKKEKKIQEERITSLIGRTSQRFITFSKAKTNNDQEKMENVELKMNASYITQEREWLTVTINVTERTQKCFQLCVISRAKIISSVGSLLKGDGIYADNKNMRKILKLPYNSVSYLLIRLTTAPTQTKHIGYYPSHKMHQH